MNTDTAKVIDRVRKMLALANDAAAAEGERDNANRMAYATLAKHNLTISDTEVQETPEARKHEILERGGRGKSWEHRVCTAIAKLFFCEAFASSRGSVIKYYFIGKESNVITARGMCEYVIKSITREGRKLAISLGYPHSGSYWNGFCNGASVSLSTRCRELRAQREHQQGTGTDLALVSLYESESLANKEYVSSVMGMKTKSATSRSLAFAGSALEAGKQYGNQLSLNNQITSRASAPALRLGHSK